VIRFARHGYRGLFVQLEAVFRRSQMTQHLRPHIWRGILTTPRAGLTNLRNKKIFLMDVKPAGNEPRVD
jgi:hypothetical protein